MNLTMKEESVLASQGFYRNYGTYSKGRYPQSSASQVSFTRICDSLGSVYRLWQLYCHCGVL